MVKSLPENKKWPLRWLAAGLLALLVAVAATPIVLAHASLVRSDPADNSILANPPKEIRLWFSEAISPEFSTVDILDISGRRIKPTGIRIDPTEPDLMVVTLPRLSPGLYSVRWKVLSKTDGHFTQGPIVFGVGQGVDMDAAATISTGAEILPPLPEVLLRWLNFGLIMSLVGAVAVAYIVLNPRHARPDTRPLLRVARSRVLGWARWCALLGLPVGLGFLAWQVAILLNTLPENALWLGVSWQLLARTRWGMLWLARQGIFLALAGTLAWQLRPGRLNRPARAGLPYLLAGLLVPALVLVQALGGHAAGLTGHTALAVVTDALHLLAAGLWVGGLLGLAAGLLPLLRQSRTDFAALARAGWQPFSRFAAFSVAVVIATGLYNTGRQVASVDALLVTLYGRALLVKVGLVLGVGLVGLTNAMLLHPRLAAPLARLLKRPAGWTPLSLKRLPALVMAEVSVGLLVVLATGLITASPQANGPEFGPGLANLPTSLSKTAGDMVVTFSAKPNRPGQNLFSIRAVSTRRPPPAAVMRVIVRLSSLDEDIGRISVDALEVEPGLYQVGGNYFSQAGRWDVQVVIRRRGIEDSAARFEWVVPPAAETRTGIISSEPVEPVLTLAAALMLLAIPAVLVAIRRRRSRVKTLTGPDKFGPKNWSSSHETALSAEIDLGAHPGSAA